MKIKDILFLNYLVWIICFIVYPSWLVSDSFPLSRMMTFLCLLSYFSINYYLIKKQLPSLDKSAHTMKAEFESKYFFILSALVFFAIQITPIVQLPVSASSDEGYFACDGILLLDKMESIFGDSLLLYLRFFVFLFIFLFLIFIALALTGTIKLDKLKTIYFSRKSSYNNYLVIIIILFGVLECFLLNDIPFFNKIHRYPPLSKIIDTASSLVFGYNIAPLRLVQLIFVITSFYYFLRILETLKVQKHLKYLFGALYLVAPWAMVFAHSAQLSGGVLFFQMIIAYYFILYLTKKEDIFLCYAATWVSIGILYKRPLFLFIAIIVISLLIIKYIKQEKFITTKSIILFSWLSFIPALPLLLIGKYSTYRSYSPILSNFLELDKITTYIRLLFEHFSVLIMIIFLLGSVYLIFSPKKREFIFPFYLIWFLVYYIFFTAIVGFDNFRGRAMLYFFVPILLVSTDFMKNLFQRHNKTLAPLLLLLLFIGISQFNDTFRLTYRKIDDPSLSEYYINSEIYLPYDKAFYYLNGKKLENKNILIINDVGEATFYIRKYKLQKNNKIFRLPRNSDYKSLKKYCLENKIDYFLLPYNITKKTSNYMTLLNHLKSDEALNNSNYFIELQTFQFRNNFIDLLKMPKVQTPVKQTVL